MTSIHLLPLAFLLDLLIGDPQFAHHPIRYMGRAIEIFEPRFRKRFSALMGGGLMAVALIIGAWAVTYSLLWIAGLIHPWVAAGLEILLIYFGIACRGLESAAMTVCRHLRDNRLDRAKDSLSMIVGRDPTRLNTSGVSAAAVETVAENLVDGLIAPLFYAAIGGAPLLMAYKMINTLDSMIGYKNETYKDFGRMAARIDDLANFIPARLSVPTIALAGTMLSGRGWQAWRTARTDGRRHASPNAGFPEAAFAGILGVRLGGPNVYHGRLVEKPYIGEGFGPVGPSHIPKACQVMVLSATLWTGLLWAVGIGLNVLHRWP